jgi:hypothetical protein
MPDWIWFENVVFPLVGMGMGVLVLFGVYRTVNRVLERRHERQLAALGGRPGVDVKAITERLEVIEDQVGRLGELEERLDFAERLLARERDADRLKGPKA